MFMSIPALDSQAPQRVKLLQTAVFCASFIGLGLCGGSLGPALAAHAARTGTQLDQISAVFIAIALGRMVGSFSGGWLVDHMRGGTQIALGIALAAAAMAVIPFTHSLGILLAVMLAYGVAANLLDVGANTLIVRVHGDKVGPYMNAMHLSFGIGGSIAPLVVGRSYAYTGDVAAAYWLHAALLVPLALWALRMPTPPRTAAARNADQPRTSKSMIALLGAFFFFLVAVEVSGTQWTFTFGERLGLSKEVGAPMLSSGFWWAYSAARLLAIPVSMRLKPGTYVAIDIVGTFICAGVTLAGLLLPNAQTLIWIGIIGMGFFIASAFPSMLSFVGSRMQVTGSMNALLFASANLGAMVGPWSIGQLFDVFGPPTVPLMGLLGMAAAMITFVIVAKPCTK
jgi:FHS family Na+ dependent glucose MFS transporter 1